MVGVRLPRKMLKKIAKVADALSADRSTAIRSILEAGLDSGRVIGLLQSGKGRGRTVK
jgi:metal-responsive CopG/Arc/MetJ family transcriptional regulator